MWAMLHNLGRSFLAKIDLQTKTITEKYLGVGSQSHGAVQWKEGMLVFVDSHSLSLLDTTSHVVTKLWGSDDDAFIKGLCVVDDIAFFGIGQAQERQNRQNFDLNCDIIAFDLRRLMHKGPVAQRPGG